MSKGTLNMSLVIGRLGKDPELRYTENGTAVASFSIATNESYKNKDGEAVETTDWHRIVVWNKLAEICGQYLKKGALVCIEGKMKTRKYNDKDGVERHITEIVANKLQMLGGKKDRDDSDDGTNETHEAPASSTTGGDDLPF